MNVKDLVTLLGSEFPENLQESYDNTGAQIIFPDEKVNIVYVSLDIDRSVIEDAASLGAGLIITHHPLIFKPIKSIVMSEPVSDSVIALTQNKISLYSMHTNYDKIMYDFLGKTLGLELADVLLKTDQLDGRDIGFGSLMKSPVKITFEQLLKNIKTKLDIDFLLYSGDRDRIIDKVACINGSGGGSVEKIIKMHKPDCIVTGDVGYHHIKYAVDSGTCIIDAGHFGTESIFKEQMAEKVREILLLQGHSADVIVSGLEKNPFRVYM